MPVTDSLKIEKYRLYDIFKIWIDNEIQSLGVTVDNEEIFTNAEVLTEMCSKYALFYWQCVNLLHYGASGFLDLWHDFVTATGAQLKRAYDALNAEYNPIENYSMAEQGLDGTRRDKTTDENTPTGTTTTTTKENRYGLGSSSAGDGQPYDGSTTETGYTNRKDTRESTPGNTMTGTFDGSTKTGYHEAHEHFFTRTGNIGTMTAADMLTKELEIRRVNLLHDYVACFISANCYYCGSEIYDDYSI